MYRVLVDATSSTDSIAPSMPADGQVVSSDTQSATISFVAPGNDGDVGTAAGYDIRYVANATITDANFETGTPIATSVTPDEAGQVQAFQLTGLLPSTPYSVGIRAYDACRNTSPLEIISFTTPDRQSGEVDACFIATAAYGSKLANDVVALRGFRDRVLRSTVFGELAIEAYYTFGPEVAGIIGESELLRATARGALELIVARVRANSTRQLGGPAIATVPVSVALDVVAAALPHVCFIDTVPANVSAKPAAAEPLPHTPVAVTEPVGGVVVSSSYVHEPEPACTSTSRTSPET